MQSTRYAQNLTSESTLPQTSDMAGFSFPISIAINSMAKKEGGFKSTEVIVEEFNDRKLTNSPNKPDERSPKKIYPKFTFRLPCGLEHEVIANKDLHPILKDHVQAVKALSFHARLSLWTLSSIAGYSLSFQLGNITRLNTDTISSGFFILAASFILTSSASGLIRSLKNGYNDIKFNFKHLDPEYKHTFLTPEFERVCDRFGWFKVNNNSLFANLNKRRLFDLFVLISPHGVISATCLYIPITKLIRKIPDTINNISIYEESPFKRDDTSELLLKYNVGVIDNKGNIVLLRHPLDKNAEEKGFLKTKWQLLLWNWKLRRVRFEINPPVIKEKEAAKKTASNLKLASSPV